MSFPTSPTEGQIHNKYIYNTDRWVLLDVQQEVGIWTPQLIGDSGSATMGTSNTGWYIRQGNLVTLGGTIHWVSANVTGNIRISGLPYTAANNDNCRSSGTYGAINGAFTLDSDCIGILNVIDPGHNDMYIIEQKPTLYKHNVTVNNAGVMYGIGITYKI